MSKLSSALTDADKWHTIISSLLLISSHGRRYVAYLQHTAGVASNEKKREFFSANKTGWTKCKTYSFAGEPIRFRLCRRTLDSSMGNHLGIIRKGSQVITTRHFPIASTANMVSRAWTLVLIGALPWYFSHKYMVPSWKTEYHDLMTFFILLSWGLNQLKPVGKFGQVIWVHHYTHMAYSCALCIWTWLMDCDLYALSLCSCREEFIIVTPTCRQYFAWRFLVGSNEIRALTPNINSVHILHSH